MTGLDLSIMFGLSQRYIRKITQQSMQKGKQAITIHGKLFNIDIIPGRGRGGKVYEYTPLQIPSTTPKSRRRGSSRVDLNELEALGINLERPSAEDRAAVVKYIISHSEYSVRAIAWGLNTLFGEKWSVESLERKLRRWVEEYKGGGKAKLTDRRGGRSSKVDREMFLMSIVKQSNLRTYYLRYCAIWSRREGVELDLWDPRSNVSYSTFARYYHAHKNDEDVRMILRGADAIEESLPVYSMAAQLSYPNQQWQIDATRIDLMVKVPVIDGEPEYFRTVESDEYVMMRYTLNGVVDAYSAARVYKLMKSGTSYGNVRLLEKAIGVLGVPELIKGDNGKDYASTHFQRVLDDLGIVYHAATPYKGSEKGKVERGFRSLQHDARFESLPGFIGHSVEQRQHIEAQAVHKRNRGGAGVQSNIREDIMWWWDAERVIDGLISKLFSEQMSLHSSEVIYSREIPHLHQRLGKSATRKLSREGVAWNSGIYTSTKLWDHYDVGDRVTVYEEIDDTSVIYVDDGRGGFITCSSDRGAITLEEALQSKRAYKKRKTAKIKKIIKSAQSEAAMLAELTVADLESRSEIQAPQVTKLSKPINEPARSSQDKLLELIREVS